MKFVTGGTGLVGAHLLLELVKNGEPVIALKRKSSNLNHTRKIFSFYTSDYKKLFDKITWVEGDILHYLTMEDMLSGVDEVYHCAALVSFLTSEERKMIQNNVQGTANLVNASLFRGVKKFCQVSSIAALGRTTDGTPVTEKTSWLPSKKNTGYSVSKFFSEAEVWRGVQEGLDAVVVNPSIILGPGNWNSGSPRLFKTVYDRLLFYTRGVSGYVDVADVIQAIILLMKDENFRKCKNQRFLLSAENRSYRALFSAIADELHKPRPRYYVPDALLGIAWRAAALGSVFTGKPPALTRDTLVGSNRKFHFDGTKITKQLPGFSYKSIDASIREISKILLREMRELPDHKG
jgi:dihydroflavonol-4-reductase